MDARVRGGRRRFGLLPMAGAAALTAAVLVVAYLAMNRPEPARQAVRAELMAADGAEFDAVAAGAMVLSPDGTRLVYRATLAGRSQLWIRDFATGVTSALAGTDNAIFPFWSPDNAYLGFFADGKLKKMPAAGGPVQVLANARDGRGGSWSAAGQIVFTPDILSAIYVVSEGGGEARAVTTMPEGEGQSFSHRNPYFLPDGRRFLFTIRDTRQNQGALHVGSIDGTPPVLVLERGSNVALSAGHMIFMRDGNLVAQPFDAASLTFTGSLSALAQDVDYWHPRDLGNFSAAGDVLVYRTAAIAPTQLGWAQPGTTTVQTFGEVGRLSQIRLSRDGRLAAVTRTEPGGASDVWLLDTQRQNLTRLTFDATLFVTYAFSPGGDRIAIGQAGHVGRRIIIMSTTGASGTEAIASSGPWVAMEDWAPDGRHLVAGVQRAETGFDLFSLDLQGAREMAPLVVAPRDQTTARVSPNGAWVAYQSVESDRSEIFVSDFPAAGRKIQVTSGGGHTPAWSQDGRQLYFVNGDRVHAMEIRDPVRMEVGSPREVVMPPDIVEGAFMPDGKRVLVLRRGATGPAPPVRLMINWTQVLK